jgi:hypothetical protein
MKHLYIALLGLGAAVTVQGQRIVDRHAFAQRPTGLTAAEVGTRDASGVGSLELVQRGGGTVLFQEDFANGFDGNNGIGAWTAEDTGGGLIWQYVAPGGDGIYANGTPSGVQPPAGEFSTNIASLNSTSDPNGWMIFDCDYFNTPIDDGVVNTEGSLTSPSIDFSSNSSVVVTWEQYFRYCCFPYAPIYLQASNDGGVTWVTFDGHGTFIQSANTASANPLTTSVDISCVAAGESDVRIRFSYLQAPETGDGYSHYYWGFDDVVISENPIENELEITQITSGDVYNVFEYRYIPLEQAIAAADGGLVAGVMYRNGGNANQTGVEVTVEILDEQSNVVSTTTETLGIVPSYGNAAACPSNIQDTVYIATGWTPTATGTYTIQATIAQAEVDEDGSNNTASTWVVYTDDEYGHDDESNLNTQFRPRAVPNSDLFEPTGYGNYWHIQNEGSTAYGMTVRFGQNSGGTGLIEFETRLYTLDPEVGLTDSPFESTYWEYNNAWTPASAAASEFVYLPFEDPIALEAGNFYFGGVIVEFETEEELTVLGNANSDTDNSTGVYSQAGSGDYVWFTSQTATPAIRLILSQRVGIDEIANLNGIELYQNVPNPAEATTSIRFELLQARRVALEIRDLQGRLIEVLDQGMLPAGTHNVVYDVAGLGAGLYTYTLVADGMRLTKKMNIR